MHLQFVLKYDIIMLEVINVENINKQIGERIAEQRKLKRMSQTELANMMGKSLRTVQKYESGDIDMSISALRELASILDIPMNYLIGYDSSHIRLESLSDVLAFIFELERKKELEFSIDITKSDMDDWSCSLSFDGKSSEAVFNADLCLVMETLRNNLEALKTYWMGYETLDAWEAKTIEYHKSGFLTDKEREDLDRMELIRRRNELDREKLKQLLSKEAESNDDSEQ